MQCMRNINFVFPNQSLRQILTRFFSEQMFTQVPISERPRISIQFKLSTVRFLKGLPLYSVTAELLLLLWVAQS